MNSERLTNYRKKQKMNKRRQLAATDVKAKYNTCSQRYNKNRLPCVQQQQRVLQTRLLKEATAKGSCFLRLQQKFANRIREEEVKV